MGCRLAGHPVANRPAWSRVPLFNNVTDNAGTTTVRFEVADTEAQWYSPSWGFCAPVWRFKIDYGSRIDDCA
jgi:hypothetical protein